jgi:flagellar motility protein MotE (MotC chaperone)
VGEKSERERGDLVVFFFFFFFYFFQAAHAGSINLDRGVDFADEEEAAQEAHETEKKKAEDNDAVAHQRGRESARERESESDSKRTRERARENERESERERERETRRGQRRRSS